MIVSEDSVYFTVRTSPEIAKAFKEHNVFFDFHTTENRLERGVLLRGRKEAVVEQYASFAIGNHIVPMGAFSYSRRDLPLSLSIGRYCSIAPGLTAPAPAHPISYASTSPWTYDRGLIAVKTILEQEGRADFPFLPNPQKPAPRIGNDVWIGENVTLMPGVTIGDGAIVATNSTVTKDVPPYAIVAGNPAVVKRIRFTEPLVENLLAVKWWRFKFTDFAALSFGRPEAFCDEIRELEARGEISPWDPGSINAFDFIKASIKT